MALAAVLDVRVLSIELETSFYSIYHVEVSLKFVGTAELNSKPLEFSLILRFMQLNLIVQNSHPAQLTIALPHISLGKHSEDSLHDIQFQVDLGLPEVLLVVDNGVNYDLLVASRLWGLTVRLLE